MSTVATVPEAALPAPAAAPAPAAPPLIIDGRVRVPAGIGDLESFRRWARSEEWPERVRFAFLAGALWIDLTMEQAYTHNDVKTEVAAVVRFLVKSSARGRYFGDGMMLSNPRADLSAGPDGMFISHATFDGGRIRQLPGRHPGVIEFEGTPDMVLEVVSDSSVEKDTVLLPPLYARAGIAEFWRIDARGELRFEILRLNGTEYVPTEERGGWLRSEVFGRSFRLTQQPDPRGQPEFTLEVQA